MYLGSSVIEVEAYNLHEVKKAFFPPAFFPLHVTQNACWSNCYIFRPWSSRQIAGELVRKHFFFKSFVTLKMDLSLFCTPRLKIGKNKQRSVIRLLIDWSSIWGGLVYLSLSLSLLLQTWGVNVCDQIEVSSGSVTGCRNALHGSFIRTLLVLSSCAVRVVEG